MKLSMPRFDQAPVLVVGDVMLDRYWHGGTSRISPEAPVPVVKVEQIEDRPGGAANVALNIAALGAPAMLVGITGIDEAADSLTDSLNAAGVDVHFQRLAEQPTIVKLRVMSRHQQLLRMDFEEAFETNAEALAAEVERLLPQARVLVLSAWRNRSKMSDRSWGSTPCPVSRTARRTVAWWRSRTTSRLPEASPAATMFT